MMTNNELERMWEEMVVSKFEVMPQYLLEATKQCQGKPSVEICGLQIEN
jgi:hypothetical protein